jgi:hypothetical protein
MVVMTFMINGSAAYAGFEFTPSTQKPAPMQKRAEISVPQLILPQIQNNMMGHPAAPVMREPLNQPAPYYAPQTLAAPIAPPAVPVTRSPHVIAAPKTARPHINLYHAPQNIVTPIAPPTVPVPQPQSVMVSPKIGRLHINPYPLKNQNNRKMMPSGQSVMQGMIEKSGRLNPVQLGAGMTTGAKPNNVVAYSASAELPVPRAPGLNSRNLTPIPGGEPAPLPGIEAAYSNKNITNQQMPTHYANAVGFGRDLPLELALSQVIPQGFSYDMGGLRGEKIVSWDGGEPWNIVLNNMLRSQNMTATIRDNQVIIQPINRG